MVFEHALREGLGSWIDVVGAKRKISTKPQGKNRQNECAKGATGVKTKLLGKISVLKELRAKLGILGRKWGFWEK